MLRWLLLVLAAMTSAHAAAEELPARRFEGGVLVFGGALLTGSFPGWTMLPFAGGLDGNYLVGGAYDRRFFSAGRFDFGWETGLASRFGDGQSMEIWSGPLIRHSGIAIGRFAIEPGLVLGLSAVSRTIGEERVREQQRGGNATLLFYVGPELAFSSERFPDWELVYRIHHRSGLLGTLGNMHDGLTANVIGVRRRF